MPFPRKRNALQFTEEERRRLASISKSRTEEKRRTLRAAILLDSLSGQSDETIARKYHVNRGTVVLCIRKCLEFGLDAALGELPRPGKPRQLPDDAIAWVLHCACQKPKDLGYSYELWTYKLLTGHVRQQCVAAGHPALQTLSRSKLHKILRKGELRPHKIRYYVECRDPAFEPKMAATPPRPENSRYLPSETRSELPANPRPVSTSRGGPPVAGTISIFDASVLLLAK